MASGVTNKGKYQLLNIVYRNATEPTNLYVALCTDAVTPTADTNTFSDLTEVTAGNGYTAGGFSLNRDGTDFDVLTEDDTGDQAFIQIKNVAWTASGGDLPSAGAARWAILTDDNVTQSAREVYAWWDLVSNRVVSVGQTLTLVDLQITIS